MTIIGSEIHTNVQIAESSISACNEEFKSLPTFSSFVLEQILNSPRNDKDDDDDDYSNSDDENEDVAKRIKKRLRNRFVRNDRRLSLVSNAELPAPSAMRTLDPKIHLTRKSNSSSNTSKGKRILFSYQSLLRIFRSVYGKSPPSETTTKTRRNSAIGKRRSSTQINVNAGIRRSSLATLKSGEIEDLSDPIAS
jgi:hypothetical protein